MIDIFKILYLTPNTLRFMSKINLKFQPPPHKSVGDCPEPNMVFEVLEVLPSTSPLPHPYHEKRNTEHSPKISLNALFELMCGHLNFTGAFGLYNIHLFKYLSLNNHYKTHKNSKIFFIAFHHREIKTDCLYMTSFIKRKHEIGLSRNDIETSDHDNHHHHHCVSVVYSRIQMAKLKQHSKISVI